MTTASGGERYVVLDVFTEEPLTGNPVAVFADGRRLPTDSMQRLARELNLSETVFVLPAREGGDAHARIFTPAVELPFAGHPVLGTAVMLGIARGRDSVVIETGSGPVPVELSLRRPRSAFGTMDQPLPSWQPFDRTDELLAALGGPRPRLPVEEYTNGPRHVCVVLDDERQVASLQPDLGALQRLGPIGVSCFAGAGRRWKTRMFAPGLGVPEDPATGSAAGPLAVHLSRHGVIGYGDEIEISQGSEIERPSLLVARADGSAQQLTRVRVSGAAVVVAEGSFQI